MFTFDNEVVRETARRIHRLSDDFRAIEELRGPTLEEFLGAPVLEDWSIGTRIEPALIGRVTGHPDRPDGPVVTSGLFYLDDRIGLARTLSRWYRLKPKSTN